MYNKSTVTSQPRLSQSPQILGSLWKLEAAPFPHYSVIKYVHTGVTKLWRPPLRGKAQRESTTGITKQTLGAEKGDPKAASNIFLVKGVMADAQGLGSPFPNLGR